MPKDHRGQQENKCGAVSPRAACPSASEGCSSNSGQNTAEEHNAHGKALATQSKAQENQQMTLATKEAIGKEQIGMKTVLEDLRGNGEMIVEGIGSRKGSHGGKEFDQHDHGKCEEEELLGGGCVQDALNDGRYR